jgi:ATP-dependent RNA helicase RhlE
VLFSDLALIEPLQRAIAAAGYTIPTPIQRAAIPPALAGRDVLGCAQTGTGKTAAFSLPILQRLDELAGDAPRLRALVLTPTRELAAQIGESLATYGHGLGLWHTVIFGGVNEKPQIQELERGIDILVATPGRLLDLLSRGFVDLSKIELFVLDEADRMLDMGFIHDVRRVVDRLPRKRQTLFFSATMPEEIRRLADTLLVEPEFVSVAPVSATADRIEQRVFFVDHGNKPRLLVDTLRDPACSRVLVFSRTKHGANRIAALLEKARIPAAAIHGNKSQGARTRALEGFKQGELAVLVATDIAARGIDIDDVSHVINYDIPNIPETYVHRIGRTARAGREGQALSFCEGDERAFLEDIEKLIGINIPRVTDHPYPPTGGLPPETDLKSKRTNAPRPPGQPGRRPVSRGEPSRRTDRSRGPAQGRSGGGDGRRAQAGGGTGPSRGNRPPATRRP